MPAATPESNAGGRTAPVGEGPLDGPAAAEAGVTTRDDPPDEGLKLRYDPPAPDEGVPAVGVRGGPPPDETGVLPPYPGCLWQSKRSSLSAAGKLQPASLGLVASLAPAEWTSE
jgi:hypothetical protein